MKKKFMKKAQWLCTIYILLEICERSVMAILKICEIKLKKL